MYNELKKINDKPEVYQYYTVEELWTNEHTSKHIINEPLFNSHLKEKSKQKFDEPKMYKVILHNDDFTPMDFVVEILMKIFNKTAAEATKIMLEVHKKGKGICGVFSYDIASTKVKQVTQNSKNREYPLQCSCEKV